MRSAIPVTLSPSAAAFVSRGSYASLLGWQIWYIDSAATAAVSGRAPLLLLHGFPTSSLDWAKVYPELSSRFRVIAFDFLGFGLSEKPRGHAYTLAEQADLAAALCDELGLGPAHLLVHDYGNTVAQELLARTDARGRWLSCCFLNGGLFPETHRPRLVQQLLLTPLGPCLSALMTKHTFARSLSGVFAPATQPTIEDLRDFWALVRYRGGSLNAHRLIGYIPQRVENRERWVGALQKTSVPLGLINGSDDPVSGAHMVQRFLQVVGPPMYLAELPEVGHYPQWEAPLEVLRHFERFLAKVEQHAEES